MVQERIPVGMSDPRTTVQGPSWQSQGFAHDPADLSAWQFIGGDTPQYGGIEGTTAAWNPGTLSGHLDDAQWRAAGYTGPLGAAGEGDQDPPELIQWMTQYGIKLGMTQNDSGQSTRILFRNGQPMGTPNNFATDADNEFALAALAAGGVMGAAAGGAFAAGGAAAGGAEAGAAGGAVGGTGLTAGGAASGAGLTASQGAGLTLAAETGTGAGLAAGTGSGVIGAGIGSTLPAVGASAIGAGAIGAGGAGAGVGGGSSATPGLLSQTGQFLKDNPGLAKLGLAAGLAGLAAAGGDDADTSSVDSSAAKAGDIGQQALDWYKQIYAEQAPDRAAAASRANAISDAQLGGMNYALDQAKDTDLYNKTTFRPLEQRLVSEAQTYDTPERRMAEAASARADVDASFARAGLGESQRLGRAGIAPGGAKSMSLMGDVALEQAKAGSGASTQAMRNVEATGYGRMVDAAAMGRGLPAQSVAQQQVATGAGNASAANAYGALQATQSGIPGMTQAYQTALSGQNVAGNLYANSARIKQGQNDDWMSGIANLGRAAGALDWF